MAIFGNIPLYQQEAQKQVVETAKIGQDAAVFGNIPGYQQAVMDPNMKGYETYSGTYQNPGTFNSLTLVSLQNSNIEVLNAMAPIAKQYGFTNVEEEKRRQTAQTEDEKKNLVRNILQTAGTASLFIPYVGIGASAALQTATFFV